jgi:hypothetical protein
MDGLDREPPGAAPVTQTRGVDRVPPATATVTSTAGLDLEPPAASPFGKKPQPEEPGGVPTIRLAVQISGAARLAGHHWSVGDIWWPRIEALDRLTGEPVQFPAPKVELTAPNGEVFEPEVRWESETKYTVPVELREEGEYTVVVETPDPGKAIGVGRIYANPVP